MAAQAGLCLAWSETSEDTFCRVVTHIYYAEKKGSEMFFPTFTVGQTCFSSCLTSAKNGATKPPLVGAII